MISTTLTAFQAQSRIRRRVALLFALVIIIVPIQIKAAEEPLDLQALTAFALFAGFGRLRRIGPVGGSLQKAFDDRVGRFENGRAHQKLQFLHQLAFRLLVLDTQHQLLDFCFLGDENVRCEVFFLKPASRSARLCWATSVTYCSIKC